MAAGPCRRLQLRLLLRGDKLLADIVPFRFAKVRPESFYGRDPFQNTKTLFRNLQNQPFHAKIRRQEDCALLLSISASHTIRERIGAVIRADHAAFSGFRSTFLGHQSRNSWSLLRGLHTSIGGGGAFCSGMAPPRLRIAWQEPSPTHADWQT